MKKILFSILTLILLISCGKSLYEKEKESIVNELSTTIIEYDKLSDDAKVKYYNSKFDDFLIQTVKILYDDTKELKITSKEDLNKYLYKLLEKHDKEINDKLTKYSENTEEGKDLRKQLKNKEYVVLDITNAIRLQASDIYLTKSWGLKKK